ncbi:Protein kinase-like domain [Trinorchestia longiramus]|nr:Protein kinase-like domain [Trinorchestia longiramus]
MFGIYGHRMRERSWDSPKMLGHDSVNYMHPGVNYDKPPRKLRPQRRKEYDSERELDNIPARCFCSSLNLDSGEHDESCALYNSDNNNDNSLLTQKTEMLTKMFTCWGVEQQADMTKHGGRYAYSALEDDGGSGGERADRLEDKQAVPGASRETVFHAAKTYTKTRQRYTLLDHLREIGSRIDKNWFSVRDTIVKTERLMTLQPHDPTSPVPILSGTREALIELFQALQHPYIYPVLDLDFATVSSHSYIVIIQPTNPKGTLKDLIYRSHWQQDWAEKYHQRSSGLPLKQVQRLGRQILEALLFLQDRGFPPCGHIHSGNIVLQNGVARLSGLENTLFGFTSRIYPIIKRRLKENRDAIDSLCFGHILFEMCAGYELSAAHPSARHLEDIQTYQPVVKVLDFIFGCGENYPSIEDILCCDFFRNLDLREMKAMPLPFQLNYSPAVRQILKEVRRYQKHKARGRRTPAEGEIGVMGVDPLSNGGSTPTNSSEASTGGAPTEELPPHTLPHSAHPSPRSSPHPAAAAHFAATIPTPAGVPPTTTQYNQQHLSQQLLGHAPQPHANQHPNQSLLGHHPTQAHHGQQHLSQPHLSQPHYGTSLYSQQAGYQPHPSMYTTSPTLSASTVDMSSAHDGCTDSVGAFATGYYNLISTGPNWNMSRGQNLNIGTPLIFTAACVAPPLSLTLAFCCQPARVHQNVAQHQSARFAPVHPTSRLLAPTGSTTGTSSYHMRPSTSPSPPPGSEIYHTPPHSPPTPSHLYQNAESDVRPLNHSATSPEIATCSSLTVPKITTSRYHNQHSTNLNTLGRSVSATNDPLNINLLTPLPRSYNSSILEPDVMNTSDSSHSNSRHYSKFPNSRSYHSSHSNTELKDSASVSLTNFGPSNNNNKAYSDSQYSNSSFINTNAISSKQSPSPLLTGTAKSAVPVVTIILLEIQHFSSNNVYRNRHLLSVSPAEGKTPTALIKPSNEFELLS